MSCEKINVGIIGCGGIAQAHINGYKTHGIDIVAVTDINAEAASKTASECNADVFETAEALLNSKKVQAVSICTPPAAHEEPAILAVEKGIHVLLEKPMTHDLPSAKRLYEAVKNSNTIVMPAFRHRFLPPIQKMRSLIQENFIGPLVFFRNVFCGPAFHMKDRWFTKKSIAGGGCILDTNSHSIDLFRFLIGEITDQKAVMHRHFDNTDVEDAGIVLVKGDNGTLGSIASSFVAGDGMAFIDVLGQNGRILYEYSSPSELKIRKRGEEWQTIKVDKGQNGFVEETKIFTDCILNTKQPPVTAFDGLRVMEVIMSIYN